MAWVTASLTTPQPPGASRAASLRVSVVRVVSGSDNTVSTMEAGRGVLEEEEPSGWMGGLCPRIWEGEASCEVEKFPVLPAGPHSCSSRPPSDPRNHGKSSSSFMPYKELPWKANH